MILYLIYVHNFHCQMMNGTMVIFVVDNSSSVFGDNKKKDILFLGEGPTDGLDDAKYAEAKYSININKSRKKFCSSVHCN